MFYMGNMSKAEKDIEGKVRGLAEDAALGLRVSLEGVEVFGRGRRMLLRVFVDKEGGITLDECGAFSRALGALLDVEDPIKGAYTLEVSSPGLDRPIKDLHDFKKQTGKLVRVVTKEKVDNQNFFIGRIAEVAEDRIVLALSGDKKVEISPENVSRARLEVEMK